MPYRDYLRLEGWCSIVLGLERRSWPSRPLRLVGGLAARPSLRAPRARAPRNGARPGRPGEWLTTGPLRGAKDGRLGLPAPALRRRLVVETAITAVTALVLVFGPSLASAAFGAVQAFAARARVEAEERRRGLRYVVAERPGIGTPNLGTA